MSMETAPSNNEASSGTSDVKVLEQLNSLEQQLADMTQERNNYKAMVKEQWAQPELAAMTKERDEALRVTFDVKVLEQLNSLEQQLAAAQADNARPREALEQVVANLSSRDWLRRVAQEALALPTDHAALDNIKARYEAQIQVLREALAQALIHVPMYASTTEAMGRKALAAQPDHAALDARLKEERERCAKVCDGQAKEPECPERGAYCAAAIRSLK
jgi:predicted RND superfamily exporter protein